MAQIYDYPKGDGTGQCIGIIEFGGGFQLSDLSTYFTSLNIKTPPQVISVSVDGGNNSPGDANADPEVMLDIEVAGAIAPAAKIVVYLPPIPIRATSTPSPPPCTTPPITRRLFPPVGADPNRNGHRRP